ncbi:hypothetical protein R1sor_020659 [Riccia sorocarpa]|uniref:Uncharacterized protein n=1 Tax=Riccia sorocarpa TaxID=122646 RepID=A0ABD3GEV3_9MARC
MSTANERVEFQLFQCDSQGQNRVLLSPIMIPCGPNSDRLHEIRLYIEDMELLDFEFSGYVNESAVKRPRLVLGELLASSQIPVEGSSIPSQASGFGYFREFDFNQVDATEQQIESVDLTEASQPSEASPVPSAPTLKDRNVAPEDGGPIRLRSELIPDDHEGLLVTKWHGNGKVEHYSNCFQNFYRQHLLLSKSHGRAYKERVGKEATDLELEAQKALQNRIDHRRLILEGQEIVVKANNDCDEEVSLIEGDLSNEKLSSACFKWKCKYCHQVHNLCPKTNNLAASLAAHVIGDRHLRKKEEALAKLASSMPLNSSRVGRPGWRLQAKDEKQQLIKVFFNSTSRSGTFSAGSNVTSSSQGNIDTSCICWGLWRERVVVNGLTADIKPFLLDQLPGKLWYAEPNTTAEIHFPTEVNLLDGTFRHICCLRINCAGKRFQDFTCDMCRGIPQEKDFRNRVFREGIASEQQGERNTGAALWDFMNDIVKNLPKKKGGNRFTATTKVTWEVVKLRAGPQVANFLTKNLCGPSLETIRREQKKGFLYVAGESKQQFRHIGETYARLKAKLGIVGPVPFIIAEDETSVKKMIRWVAQTDSLMGFCGRKEDTEGEPTTVSKNGRKDGHTCVHDFSVLVGDGEEGYNIIVDTFKDCVKSNYARILMANLLHSSLPALLILGDVTLY